MVTDNDEKGNRIMARKASVLSGFKEAERIPPRKRSSWATQVLDAFIEDDRKVIYTEFDTDKAAIGKIASLTKAIKAEGSPYAGKVNVERRGNVVYLERIEA